MDFCKFCELRDWDDPRFSSLAAEIMGGEAVKHRKLWEFTQTVRALERFGVLDERAHVLSIAAGTERVLYYLANKVRRIVATDIYGLSSFAEREATTDFLSEPEKFAPYAYRRDHLAGLSMDALRLRFPDASMDAVFSLSSIEHFGGISAALRSLAEIERVMKPGAIAIVITDCALNDRGMDQVFTRRDMERLLASTSLSLVEPVCWTPGRETLEHVTDFNNGDLAALPHINLRLHSSIFSSLSVVLKKAGQLEFSEPEAFDEMLMSVASLPFLRSEFQTPLGDRLRGKLRCWARQVEQRCAELPFPSLP